MKNAFKKTPLAQLDLAEDAVYDSPEFVPALTIHHFQDSYIFRLGKTKALLTENELHQLKETFLSILPPGDSEADLKNK